MNLLEINPYIRLAMQSELVAPCCINRRIILDYELLYIEDGEFTLNYNEKDFLCKRGDILLLCPNIPHSFHVTNTNLMQPHIHFDMKYDSLSEKAFICFRDYHELTVSERLLIRENVFLRLKDSPYIKISDKNAFLKSFYEIIYSKEFRSLSCKSSMLHLLEMIISENSPENFQFPPSSPGIAFLVKSYIDANYEREMQLCDLERQFGYSKFYIEKLFRQEYNMSVIHYRNSKRMAAAPELLQKHSVSQTAQMLGFSSIYAFSRAFRLMYGMSPKKFNSEGEAPASFGGKQE